LLMQPDQQKPSRWNETATHQDVGPQSLEFAVPGQLEWTTAAIGE
jgi:hypothetical protein